jgi:hypothetical protein
VKKIIGLDTIFIIIKVYMKKYFSMFLLAVSHAIL